MKPRRIILVLIGIVALGWIGMKAERSIALHRADREMVAKADAALVAALAADAELLQRLGSFKRIGGSGFERKDYQWQLIERIETRRTAVFDRGSVPMNVSIFCDQARDLGTKSIGTITWQEDAPGGGLTVDINLKKPRELPWMISAAVLSADASTVSLSGLNRVEIWDRKARTRRQVINGNFGLVHHLSQAADSNHLLMECSGRLLAVDPVTGTFDGSFPFHGDGTFPIAGISADGRVVVEANYHSVPDLQIGLVHELIARTTNPLIITGRPSERARSVVITPDGRHALMSIDGLSGAQCWDLGKQALAWTKDDPVSSRRFSGKHGTTCTPKTGRWCVGFMDRRDGGVEIWNPDTGDLEKTMELPPALIWGRLSGLPGRRPMMAVSADEQRLALVFESGDALIWDISTGKLAATIPGNGWELESMWKEGRGWVASSGASSGSQFGKHAAIGFDETNTLIGVSHDSSAAWLWKAAP